MFSKFKLTAGVVLTLGGITWFLYDQNDKLKQENLGLQLKTLEQDKTIHQIETSYRNQTKELSNLTKSYQKIEEDMQHYLKVFRRHDLTYLASKKPKLIEKRINNATKKVFEQISNNTNHSIGY